jgi:hypothetical protein
MSSTGMSGQFTLPRRPLLQRINLRMVLLAALAMLLIGGPFYVWARDAMSGGIINHGDYSDVNLKAMSSFDLDQTNGQPDDVPAKFRALEGKRVRLVGEMWAPRDAGDGYLGYFQLVYSKTKCCFNGPPLAQHFVDSNVKPGTPVYYDPNGMVSVWGTLHVHFRRDADSRVIKSVYEVDVDRVDSM